MITAEGSSSSVSGGMEDSPSASFRVRPQSRVFSTARSRALRLRGCGSAGSAGSVLVLVLRALRELPSGSARRPNCSVSRSLHPICGGRLSPSYNVPPSAHRWSALPVPPLCKQHFSITDDHQLLPRLDTAPPATTKKHEEDEKR